MSMDVARVFQLLDAQPFVPFEVDLENGHSVPVRHPENVIVFPDRARVKEILVYFPENDGRDIIWPKAISALHVPIREKPPEVY
jgi:hypothetical protein